MAYVLAGIFLPLFPLSMLFNAVLARVRGPLGRGFLLLVWPQIGLWLLQTADVAIPGWISGWAVLTSALYGLRALALREVGLWSGFLATSAWALLWIPALAGTAAIELHRYALGFSAPLLLLALLATELERRFGAAYTGIYSGLGQTLPRLTGVVVVAVLAAIATPLFPSFFSMLATVVAATPAAAVALLGIWLLWSWAGMRLLQGLVAGPGGSGDAPDLSTRSTWAYAVVLCGLIIAGLSMSGGLR